MSKTKVFVLLVAILMMAMGCHRQGALVRAPFSKVNLDVHSILFEAAKGDTLLLENGTSIIVPPNAFIDPDGKPVRGQVKLTYREMKDQAEILVSGIPMNTFKGDQMSALESAIMWEVRAFQDSTELSLDSLNGKTLQSGIASNNPGSEYDLYYLDEKQADWKTISEVAPQENERYTDALVNVAKASRDAQAMDMSNTFVLNYIEQIDVYDMPKGKVFNYFLAKLNPGNDIIRSMMEQKVSAYNSTWLRPIPVAQHASFEGIDYPAALLLWETNKDIPRWLNNLKDAPYLEVEVKKLRRKKKGSSLYKLTFKKGSFTPDYEVKWQVVHSMKAWPKMPLRDLFIQQAELRNEAYNSLLRFSKEQQKIVETQDRVIREFEIQRMGIYNYDKPFSPQNFVVDAKFNLKGQRLSKHQEIYVLTEERNTVIRYGSSQTDQFRIYPKIPMTIFAVGAGDTIYMVSPNRMKRIDYKRLRLYADKPKLYFTLDKTDFVIKEPNSLREFVDAFNATNTIARTIP